MGSEQDPELGGATHEPVDGDQPATSERWPIGFMLTIVMVSLYLGYRLVQAAVKLFQWLF